ncbi:MAG: hypothetical protein JKX80_00570 [Candidatus Pacebacteria bacterium]|nr:hypothetical protein [Candidatus Paceibacterota bacterium]
MNLMHNIVIAATVAAGCTFSILLALGMLIGTFETIGDAPVVSNMGSRLIEAAPFVSIGVAALAAGVTIALFCWRQVQTYQEEER